MSLCRRPYIDNIKEFSQGEKDRLTTIDNEIWEQAKNSKLFVKVYPKVGNPAYQIKNSASVNSIYNFISETNKKYNKKIVSLVKKTGFNKEVLSINVIPLNKETQGVLFSEIVEEKKDLKDLGLQQRLFNGSKITTSLEILNKIANSDHNLALLAAHLLPYAKYNNVKINLVENIKPSAIAKNPIGTYNTLTNEIEIKRTANFTSGRAEATILHEIIHSLTANELEIDTEATIYFNELYNHASLYLDTLNLYGLSNTDEFMTALFTDANFVTKLKNIPPLNKKKYTNLFNEVFDKILSLLGITKSYSFYEEAFSTATNIIENFRQREIEKTIQQEEYEKEYEEYLKSPAYQKQLFSEEQPIIKPGVEELFDSNPELANQVYEALGFKNKLKTSLGKELEYKDPYVSKSRLKNFKKYEVLDENNKNIGTVVIEYRGDKSVILHPKLNVIGKGYGKDLYKIVASTFDVEIQEWSEGAIDNSISAKKMWDSLEKEGVAKRVFDTEQGDNFRVLKINSQITPQQKQQALEQYSAYLDSIFPDSKVKDIVYHGTDTKFDKFDKTKPSKTLFADGTLTQKDVIYFSKNKEIGTNLNEKPKVVLSAIVDLKETITVVGKRLDDKISRELTSIDNKLTEAGLAKNRELYDSLKQQKEILKTKQSDLSIYVGNLTKENLEKVKQEYPEIDGIIWGNKEIIVFEPEQIHILGNKQDIENFTNFVKNSKIGNTESMQNYMNSKSVDYIMEKLIQSRKIEKKC